MSERERERGSKEDDKRISFVSMLSERAKSEGSRHTFNETILD